MHPAGFARLHGHCAHGGAVGSIVLAVSTAQQFVLAQNINIFGSQLYAITHLRFGICCERHGRIAASTSDEGKGIGKHTQIGEEIGIRPQRYGFGADICLARTSGIPISRIDADAAARGGLERLARAGCPYGKTQRTSASCGELFRKGGRRSANFKLVRYCHNTIGIEVGRGVAV